MDMASQTAYDGWATSSHLEYPMARSSTTFRPGHPAVANSGSFRPGGHPGREFRSVPMAESHLYKGDDVGYDRAHRRARSLLDMSACQHCGASHGVQVALRKDAMVVKTDSKRGIPYSPRSSDYIPLCVKCHRAYDEHGAKSAATWRAKHGKAP